ncbi:DUF362 domain-containing protein [Acetivibrio mesophilus]|uniref:DUF362 domain-containing protein n=1 Tax=Acetivibrio mesophilus TaxID=2487273 RepID=A0A4Q0I7U9_9FIRM|nr:DUF362 domain-containing protein [Acetivibrio mesophilus]ODM25045.1 hypothetical protein A7W90_01755 [Clostridium sp. Bc-iso-3]RXE59955.1 DUF362 domain-containing protein [Acetivibrio mesophilus]HHV29459.1 DUF362 domain-containing protein [Clostridium sp.]
MSKVALIRCESYDYNAVKASVKRGLELLGGPHKFAAPDEKILLKPNLLSADPPERCSTTHPSVFKAVAEIFKEAGISNLTYGDSPGIHKPITAAKKTGLEQAANELGIKLADFLEGKEVFFEDAIQNKKFIIANGVLESNGIISLPKLKTHGFARMTGCVKNQFGCIPGPLKGEFHVRIPSIIDFSKMLVDLNVYLKPRLFVMDGIMAMEGNGPRGGTPKKMNAILLSSDPIALDATVCRMIDLNPEFVPTIVFGKESGLGTYAENEIEILGDDIQSFINPDFDVRREPVKPFKPGGTIQFLRNSIVPKPYIDESKCIKCGVCVNICPVKPKAVDWHDGNKKEAPTYIYRRCIRCYCCQELCPESAIHLKVPFIRKFFYKPNQK